MSAIYAVMATYSFCEGERVCIEAVHASRAAADGHIKSRRPDSYPRSDGTLRYHVEGHELRTGPVTVEAAP